MATKTITITKEAYERLAVLKETKESFSDVITKITRKYSLFDLVGVLSKDEASKLIKAVGETRKRIRDQIEGDVEELK